MKTSISAVYRSVYPSGAIGTKICVEKKFHRINDNLNGDGTFYKRYQLEWLNDPPAGTTDFNVKAHAEETQYQPLDCL